MTDDTRATIGERYCTATESSNLRVGERPGDIDMIIAAGLMPDGLAAALFRLQVEYDGVRSEHRAAEMKMRQDEAKAKAQQGEGASQRAEAIMAESEQSALVAHVLILTRLTALRDAKERFGAFALKEANRRRLLKTDREVAVIAGRVLDVWLNPTCRHCSGRGFNGATHRGEVQTLCRPCRGSGHRRDSIGKDDAERNFAGHLMMQTDAMLSEAQREIARARHQINEAKKAIAAAALDNA